MPDHPHEATVEVRVGDRLVGPGHPCVVIAEIGVNHNGSLATARALVAAAKSAGADYAKFQTFRADHLVTRGAAKAPYQRRQDGGTETQYDMLKRLELRRGDFAELKRFCGEQGIGFLSTPYGEEDAALLDELGVDAIKVPSALIVEPAFLRTLAAYGRPLILSTGMAALSDVRRAVETVCETGNTQIIVLQCTTDYPTAPEDANVRVVRTLAETLGVPVGFSDHTRSMAAAIAAVALGASVIEKHLTLDKRMEGPDHAASAEPQEFSALVGAVRETELALGRPDKQPTASEHTNARSMRRSIVTSRSISVGETVQPDMIAFKRPGTGIPPRNLPEVVGARARVEIPADALIEWWMLDRTGNRRAPGV
ncbi:MAG: N-acetylneuraminate synthase family protein [Acidobacteriota bacterium]